MILDSCGWHMHNGHYCRQTDNHANITELRITESLKQEVKEI